MYTFENGYAIPKYVTIMVNTQATVTGSDSNTGESAKFDLTNIIEVEDYINHSGTKMKLNPYEYKIINNGIAPLYIHKKDSSGNYSSIGVIPTNSYTNIFMYTDAADNIQCYFQS